MTDFLIKKVHFPKFSKILWALNSIKYSKIKAKLLKIFKNNHPNASKTQTNGYLDKK